MVTCEGIFCLIAVLIAVSYLGINIYLTRKHFGSLIACEKQKGLLFLLKCLTSFLPALVIIKLVVYLGLVDDRKKTY